MPVIEQVPLDKIKLDPGQPRKRFDEEELRQLGESLKLVGMTPLDCLVLAEGEPGV